MYFVDVFFKFLLKVGFIWCIGCVIDILFLLELVLERNFSRIVKIFDFNIV